MDLAWIAFGLLGWAVALFLVLILMRMAGDQDHAARRAENDIQFRNGSPAHGNGYPPGDRLRSSSEGPNSG